MARWILGLDLGKISDYTALVAAEPVVAHGERPKLVLGSDGMVRPESWQEHHVRHIWRPPLGTSYREITAQIKGKLNAVPQWHRCRLVVDSTGVGVAVVEMLQAELPSWVELIPAMITSGSAAPSQDARGVWHVAKRDLVSVLQRWLGERRWKVSSGVDHAKLLSDEIRNFKLKISQSGHDTYEAAREGEHDDIVLAAALALWWQDYCDRGEEHRPLPPGHPLEDVYREARVRNKARARQNGSTWARWR